MPACFCRVLRKKNGVELEMQRDRCKLRSCGTGVRTEVVVFIAYFLGCNIG